MRLWDWALAAYRRPGAADACLALQDLHGQNTCLLLFAAWARSEDPEVMGEAARLARMWDAVAVAPLRQARRGLKSPAAGVPDAAREALRRQVKAIELQAERVLLESLEPLAVGGRGASAERALLAAVAAWGRPAPGDAVAALAQALD